MNKFKQATDSTIYVEYPNETIEVNIEKVTRLNSTIFFEKQIKIYKKIVWFMTILSLFLFVLNFISNFTEKKVPSNEVSLIEYRPAHNDYQIQPKGYGTSIYPVHLGKDGDFYYSRNTLVFIFFLFFSMILIISAWLIKLIFIRPYKKYFDDNNHTITLSLSNSVDIPFYVGTKENTSQVFNDLKTKHERIQMK